MVFENIINKHFPGWNWIKVGGAAFDDIFRVEDYPLWWFYSRFVTSHVFYGQQSLMRGLKNNKSSRLSNVYLNSKTFIFKNYFYYNEKMKRQFAVKNIRQDGDTIIFLTYTNHYDPKSKSIFRIQRLVDLIRIDKKLIPLVLYTDPVSKKFSMNIKRFIPSIYGFIVPDDEGKARELALSFARRWNKLDKSALFNQKWGLVKPTMDLFFSFEFMYNTILYYLTCKRIIQEQQVKAVVLTSRNGLFDRCMMAAAHHLKIPTFLIQHGIGLAMSEVAPETTSGVKHAVFGEIFKQRLLALDVREEDIIITGPLIFDDIVPFIGKAKKKGKIVLITEPFIEENRLSKEKYFRYIETIIDSLQGLYSELIIKLHPREKTKQDYEALLLRKGIKKAVIADTMGSPFLYSTICDASLVVNFLSTVALEAMIMDVPVLTIDPLVGTSHLFENGPYKGGIMIPIDGKVREAVMEALQDSKRLQQRRKEAVKEFCYKVDGNATARMAQEIYRSIAR